MESIAVVSRYRAAILYLLKPAFSRRHRLGDVPSVVFHRDVLQYDHRLDVVLFIRLV